MKYVLFFISNLSLSVAMGSMPSPTPAPTPASEIAGKLTDLKYLSEREFESHVVLKTTLNEEDSFAELTLESLQVGKVMSGPLRGSTLSLVMVHENDEGPCYPPGACQRTKYWRILKSGAKAFLIKKSSDDTEALKKFTVAEAFKKQGLQLIEDAEVELPGVFVRPEIVFDDAPRKKLQLIGQSTEFGDWYFKKFRVHPNVGQVFIARPEKIVKVWEINYSKIEDFGYSTASIYGVRNQDGTYSIYGYLPDLYRNHRISPTLPHDYTHIKRPQCFDRRPLELMDILADQSAPEASRPIIAKTFSGEPLYAPSEAQMKSLYQYYLETKGDAIATSANRASSREDAEKEHGIREPKSLEEFKSDNPMAVWKNPLGQWMGFIRYRFLPVPGCG